MKHACILFCYNNYDHIVKCYESLITPNIDYFVLENKSKYSDKIETYFKSKNIKKYMQFEKNISNNAIPIFFKEYRKQLEEYDYITFTDCDVEVTNSKSTFDEILKNLNINGVGMSCVDLSMENFPYSIAGSDSWIPAITSITDEYIECATGGHMMTIKKENFNIFFNSDPFLDGSLLNKIYSNGLIWVKTKVNKALHLTWDLYHDNDDYFQFKLNNPDIWKHSNTSNYKKII